METSCLTPLPAHALDDLHDNVLNLGESCGQAGSGAAEQNLPSLPAGMVDVSHLDHSMFLADMLGHGEGHGELHTDIKQQGQIPHQGPSGNAEAQAEPKQRSDTHMELGMDFVGFGHAEVQHGDVPRGTGATRDHDEEAAFMPKGNELFGMMWQSHTPIELFDDVLLPGLLNDEAHMGTTLALERGGSFTEARSNGAHARASLDLTLQLGGSSWQAPPQVKQQPHYHHHGNGHANGHHAAEPAAPSGPTVAGPATSLSALRTLYKKVYGRETTSNNRQWLLRRLAQQQVISPQSSSDRSPAGAVVDGHDRSGSGGAHQHHHGTRAAAAEAGARERERAERELREQRERDRDADYEVRVREPASGHSGGGGGGAGHWHARVHSGGALSGAGGYRAAASSAASGYGQSPSPAVSPSGRRPGRPPGAASSGLARALSSHAGGERSRASEEQQQQQQQLAHTAQGGSSSPAASPHGFLPGLNISRGAGKRQVKPNRNFIDEANFEGYTDDRPLDAPPSPTAAAAPAPSAWGRGGAGGGGYASAYANGNGHGGGHANGHSSARQPPQHQLAPQYPEHQFPGYGQAAHDGSYSGDAAAQQQAAQAHAAAQQREQQQRLRQPKAPPRGRADPQPRSADDGEQPAGTGGEAVREEAFAAANGDGHHQAYGNGNGSGHAHAQYEAAEANGNGGGYHHGNGGYHGNGGGYHPHLQHHHPSATGGAVFAPAGDEGSLHSGDGAGAAGDAADAARGAAAMAMAMAGVAPIAAEERTAEAAPATGESTLPRPPSSREPLFQSDQLPTVLTHPRVRKRPKHLEEEEFPSDSEEEEADDGGRSYEPGSSYEGGGGFGGGKPRSARKAQQPRKEQGGRRSKHHNPWALEETETLIEGVARCGGGKWADIKKLGFSSIEHRTAVDLKDKWRNLLRIAMLPPSAVKTTDKKREIPQSLLHRVRELAGAHSRQRMQDGRSGRGRANKSPRDYDSA